MDKGQNEEQKQKLVNILKTYGPEYDDWQGVDLSGVNLAAASLSEGDFRNTNLSKANLRGASLMHSDLRGANLQGANLDHTLLRNCQIDETTQIEAKYRLIWELINLGVGNHNLRGQDLSNSNLERVNFSQVDLRGANLNHCSLSKVNFQEADLRGASLLNISSPYSCDLHRTKIDDTTQVDDKLRLIWEIVNQGAEGRDFGRLNLSVTDLRGANLTRANLREAQLRGTKLQAVSLRGSDLSKADISGAELNDADLRDANFSGAKLRANLCGADLRGANLSGVDWFNARYDRLTQWPEGFDPTQFGLILIETEDP